MPITELLQRVHSGDPDALRTVIPLVYEELRKLAAAHLRREAGPRPLETTALVHEAFLKLAGGSHPAYENRSHFFGLASRLMRQILVDFARARRAEKRSGGGEVQLAGWHDAALSPDASVLAVDAALEKLAREDALQAQLIEMRFFGGMTAEESASVLDLSPHAVRRKLRIAQAWLLKELAG